MPGRSSLASGVALPRPSPVGAVGRQESLQVHSGKYRIAQEVLIHERFLFHHLLVTGSLCKYLLGSRGSERCWGSYTGAEMSPESSGVWKDLVLDQRDRQTGDVAADVT